VARSGASVIGARKFLVAYNVNLNTLDKRLANRVALDVREKGRMRRDEAGEPVLGADGKPLYDPGILRSVKASAGRSPSTAAPDLAQPHRPRRHAAARRVRHCDERARERGLRATGSELVGLVPKAALIAAGRHYVARMGRSTGIPESALIHVAIRTLGLGEVKPFDPAARIIEYRIAAPAALAR